MLNAYAFLNKAFLPIPFDFSLPKKSLLLYVFLPAYRLQLSFIGKSIFNYKKRLIWYPILTLPLLPVLGV